MLLLCLGACVNPLQQQQPQPPSETDILLLLASQVIGAGSPEQRRSITEAERARFQTEPSYDNLLRLTVVRAFEAALPAELREVQADLQALAQGRAELSESQRRLALIVLTMVDQRLSMGGQITSLQSTIDSLTEIEASLTEQAGNGPTGGTP